MKTISLLALWSSLLLSPLFSASLASDRIFRKLDNDQSQTLQLMEFARMMGDTLPRFSGYELRTYREFFRADQDQSSALSASEFSLWLKGNRRTLAAETYERFAIVDANRDQLLDAKEFARLYQPRLTKKAAQQSLTQLDANADGKLTRAECFRYLPMDRATFLGMKRTDAEQLLDFVQVKSFVWRDDDIAYPYDPVRDEIQPLFFFGVNGGIITECTVRLDLASLRGQSTEEVMEETARFGLRFAAPSFPRYIDCLTTFVQPPSMNVIYCPPYDSLNLPFPLNLGADLPQQLYVEIGSFEGVVEHLSLTRGGQQLYFTQ